MVCKSVDESPPAPNASPINKLPKHFCQMFADHNFIASRNRTVLVTRRHMCQWARNKRHVGAQCCHIRIVISMQYIDVLQMDRQC